MSDERKLTAEQPNNELLINAAHIAGEFIPAGISRADLAKRIVRLATAYAAALVAEERRKCCKDVCRLCARGVPIQADGAPLLVARLKDMRDDLAASAEREKRLREVLTEIQEEAWAYMEGAGEPDFGRYEWIAGRARAALDAEK